MERVIRVSGFVTFSASLIVNCFEDHFMTESSVGKVVMILASPPSHPYFPHPI